MGRPVMGRKSLRRLLSLSLLLLGLGGPVFGQAEENQENLDNIFSGQGIIGESKEGVDVKSLTADKKPHFSGSAMIGGGFVFGLNSWDQPITAPGVLAFIPYYLAETDLQLDVRPTSFLRFYGSLTISSPYSDPDTPGYTAVAFSPAVVDELFMDYTLAELLYFRLGKQDMTWGQGRLFDPGDFMLQAIDSISVKAFLPLGPNGLTLVALGEGVLSTSSPPAIPEPSSYYSDISDLIALAGLFETSLASFSFGVSAYYRNDPGLKIGAYLKRTISSVDVSLEGVAKWGPYASGFDSGVVLTSLFWEGGRRKWQLILEYLFDTYVPNYQGHSLGLGATVKELLPKGWKPSLRWVHSFADNSGQVLVGLDGPIAPYLRLAVGFPVRYGAANGYYNRYLVTELPGVEFLEHFQDTQIPGNTTAAVVVLLTLSVNF
jgi:hypothetical protein